MKRHKLLNNRNEKLFNRLLENQGLKHESSIKEEEKKPDYRDLDGDGNKDEPMEKAAKDAKAKKEVTEGEVCPKCGKSPCECEMKEEQEEVREGIMAMHCPQCGTLNSKANNHCTNCGAKLSGEEKVDEAHCSTKEDE
jgi:hypothetical protein